MATQNIVNLNQSYFPMYLTETLHFNKVYHYLKYISLTFSSLNVRVFVCGERAGGFFLYLDRLIFFLYLKRRSGEVLSAIKWGLEVPPPPSPKTQHRKFLSILKEKRKIH